MDRKDVAYMINTTPKYFFLLKMHLTMLWRYAPSLKWPVFLVTEEPENEEIRKLVADFPDLRIIPITPDKEAFFESRAEGVRGLPEEIQYVFPIQEDFILEGRPMSEVLKGILDLMDESPSISSARLMPSPGPVGEVTYGDTEWRILDDSVDEYVFTFQATLWRRGCYLAFMDALIEGVEKEFVSGPCASLTAKQKADIQVKLNVGECRFGQDILKKVTNLHLAWPRYGKQANAVYLCPWPYRPTAVVQGRIEGWALDLALREGVSLCS